MDGYISKELHLVSRKFFKTTDGGINWQVVSVFPGACSIDLRCFLVNENIGWFFTYCVDSKIYQTTDGGNTWTNIYSASKTAIRTIKFSDESNGYAIINADIS